MSIKDDGGPAFPTLPEHGFNTGMPGLTLRDAFAKAVVSDILMHVIDGCEKNNKRVDNTYVIAAKASYELADAMLEARK